MTTQRLAPTTTLRVLLAEPDRQRREFYRDAFHAVGCDVIEAADGREALIEALVRKPSLIVMRNRLPLVNGPALCEILRRDSVTRSVPIVAMMDGESLVDAERMQRAGADSIIPLPVECDALLQELVRLTSGGYGATVRDEPQRAALAAVSTSRKRQAVSRIHPRFSTTEPPATPPALRCPTCDGHLTYEQSYVGGVSGSHSEQWDQYHCATCGDFEYRHRTRKLRHHA